MPHVIEQQRADFLCLCDSFQTASLSLPSGKSIKVNFYSSESGKKGIIFVHGLGSNRKVWVKCADIARKEGLSIAFFDLRGHGDSYEDMGPFTLEQMALDVEEVINDLRRADPGTQWLLVGHSYGGNIVLELASRGKELGIVGAVCVDGGFISLKDVYATIEDCQASPLVPPRAFTDEGIPLPDLLRTVRELWLREPREDCVQALLANFTSPPSYLVRTRLLRENFMSLLSDLYRNSPRDVQAIWGVSSPVLILPAARMQTTAFTKDKRADVEAIYTLKDGCIGGCGDGEGDGRGSREGRWASLKKVVEMDCDLHEIPLERPEELMRIILAEFLDSCTGHFSYLP